MPRNPRPKLAARAAPAPPPPAGEARVQAIVISLAAVGVLAWLGLDTGRGIGWARWAMIGVAAAIGCLPPMARLIAAAVARVRHPSPRARQWTALLVGILSAAYFILTAFNQGRDLFPKTHDDCSYLIGMQMLARGRLWMPPLPLPDFFDSFDILVRPVYCSLYFPGTALLYVPTVWLHWPSYLMPAMASGAVVAMLYLIVTELLDGAAGLLAAVILASLSWFRVYSILLTSHVPMLLFGLLLIWAWLRWREGRQLRWALAMGVFAGWAAITRPADALVYALPLGIAIGWDLLKHRPRGWPAVPALLVAGAAPFLLLQMVFDLGVTGHPLRAPYGYYLERDQPNTSFGFRQYDASAQPQSTLPEKRESYDHWRPYLQAHAPGNVPQLWARRWLPMIAEAITQCRLMLLFIPIALAGLGDRRRLILMGTLPLFVLIYSLNPIFLEHYAILIMPAVIFAILLGGRTLAAGLPRWERQVFAAFVLAVLTISGTSFWEVNRHVSTAQTAVSDETFSSPLLQILHDRLAEDVTQPAVVLFTYHPGGRFFEEPVYNTDVAWPDDAPVIRAHDLGDARNREIYAYYARTQPERMFYRFDPQATPSLKELGRARDLAPASTRPAQ
ncbi:MAG: putative rane protein [Phycisphaerales bacterium]|nr:putative rane protein [Phycisphaerales bacterium]